MRLALALVVLSGCSGLILDPAGTPGAPPGVGPPEAPEDPPSMTPEEPVVPSLPPVLAASGMRRLTRAEYRASIELLLGADAPVHPELLPIDSAEPFDNFSALQIPSVAFVEATESHADELAIWTVSSAARAEAIYGCPPIGFDDATCFRHFVETFGRRAFRRVLTADEVEAFSDFFEISVEDSEFSAGARYALAAFLAHPAFLYRIEESGSGRPLSGFELATRLAYLYTGAGPDDVLLDAAASGALAEVAGVRAAADRLWTLPAAKTQLSRIHALWLGYDRFADDGLYGAMRHESNALVERTVFEDRNYLELFTARESWLEPELSAHYEIVGVPADSWQTNPDPRRAGILAHASVLVASSNTNDTSPTRRGKFIRERLLCETIPPPPPEVDADQPPDGTTPGACKEQRYEEHRTKNECRGCHAMMDPIGFGLEHFDNLGRARTHDDGRPECVISGQGALGPDAAFSGPAELGRALIASGELEGCVAEQLASFALGRKLSALDAHDRALRGALAHQFREAPQLRLLLLELVTSDAFRTRLDSEGP